MTAEPQHPQEGTTPSRIGEKRLADVLAYCDSVDTTMILPERELLALDLRDARQRIAALQSENEALKAERDKMKKREQEFYGEDLDALLYANDVLQSQVAALREACAKAVCDDCRLGAELYEKPGCEPNLWWHRAAGEEWVCGATNIWAINAAAAAKARASRLIREGRDAAQCAEMCGPERCKYVSGHDGVCSWGILHEPCKDDRMAVALEVERRAWDYGTGSKSRAALLEMAERIRSRKQETPNG